MSNGSALKKKKKNPVLPYILLIPAFVLLGVFSFYPFIKTIVSSFSITDELGRWIRWGGLFHWKMLFESDRFWQVIGNTFKFAGVTLVLTLAISMTLALVGARTKKARRLVTTLFALPLAISHSAAAVIWKMFFDTADHGGFINAVFGTDKFWLLDTKTAIWCVAVATVWTHIASCYILLMAGFRNVSTELIEASTLDGANAFVRATRIMIPLASPQIFYVLFLSIITAFETFTQIHVLTGGGPAYTTTTITEEIYFRVNQNGMFESACCFSLILFLIIFVVTRIQLVLEKKLVFYQ